jgi:hypothetical protein
MTVSNKFAHLPNGIIREIVAYTGATFKKRNGKYMGQIPKDDLRYALLHTIPKKIITFAHNCANSYINLKQNSENNLNFIMNVNIGRYNGEIEIIKNFTVGDRKTGRMRTYQHLSN